MFYFFPVSPAELFQPEKRKLNYLGLFYLKSVIPAITTTTQFVEVFSHGVSQCVLRNLFSKHGGLWEITKSVGDSIVTLAATSQDGHLQSAILRHLLCLSIRYAQAQFFLAIIKKLNPEGASMFSCDLMKLLIGEKLRKDVSFTQDSIRKWAALQLRFLVSKPALVVDNNQLLSILQFLCLHSFFTVNSSADQLKHVNGPVPQPLLDPVRICVQDCFFGAINNLNIPVSEKSQRRDLSTYLQVLYKLTRYAQSLLAADAVSTVKELPEQVVEELEMALDTVQKIQAKKTSSTPDSQAFQMLYLHLSLQLLAEPKDALEILKDLHICFEKSQKKVKKSSKNKEGDDLAWIEVLTELLISMMSQESRLTRSVSRIVFRLLSQHVTKNALDLIINVLHTTDDEGEEGPITFEDEDADSNEEDDDKQDDTTVNGNHDKNGNHDNHGDDDVSEDDDDVDMGDDSGEDVDVDHLRQTVKAALGPAAAESDKDEESDEEMGDEEMFRIDDTLSEAFKSMQRGKTKEMKKRKQQLLKFKLRTVDLVETFVKSQPPAGLLVHLVGPMLDLMESGYRHKEESSLGKRAATVLHHILKLRKVRPHLGGNA
ncbi:myb-binding protein 1A-like protein [Liolophura sinensis]|uniref:myb-binding protein 1A-like protein n=1 Tax=Liolophura sinensis TaxID=3198878 RepID=UPI003159358A